MIYSGEIAPGHVPSTNNRRQFQGVYWSFLELGAAALSHEEAWFCMMVEMSSVVNGVAAGMSQVFGALLKVFFDPCWLGHGQEWHAVAN